MILNKTKAPNGKVSIKNGTVNKTTSRKANAQTQSY